MTPPGPIVGAVAVRAGAVSVDEADGSAAATGSEAARGRSAANPRPTHASPSTKQSDQGTIGNGWGSFALSGRRSDRTRSLSVRLPLPGLSMKLLRTRDRPASTQ